MQIVHELGHIANGLLSGARVNRVTIHPLRFSLTEFSHNPSPVFVTWGGPAWGIAIPLVLLGIAHLCHAKAMYLFRFFAGFCLIANGAYLAVGWIDSAGDAGDLRRSGVPIWILIAFGVITIPLGLALWNGVGRRMGIGRASPPPTRGVAIGALILLLITASAELIVGR